MFSFGLFTFPALLLLLLFVLFVPIFIASNMRVMSLAAKSKVHTRGMGPSYNGILFIAIITKTVPQDQQ